MRHVIAGSVLLMSVLGASSARAAVFYDNTSPPQFGGGALPLGGDEIAEGVPFNGAHTVTGFTTFYHADTEVNATFKFYSVAGLGQGPGAVVASFTVPNLAAGDHVLEVQLSAAQQFVWTATPGLSNAISGGFFSFKTTSLSGASSGGGGIFAAAGGIGLFDVTTHMFLPIGEDTPPSPFLQIFTTDAVTAAPSMTGIRVTESRVTSGATIQGVVSLNQVAPAGGISITITATTASVPATVVVPAGETLAVFDVVVNTVSSPTSGGVTAQLAPFTRTASFVASPAVAPDQIAITQAEYVRSKHSLSVTATSSAASAMLTVVVAATGETIGTLTSNGRGRFTGQLSFPFNPGEITVNSSLGGSDSADVTVK
jgi:hypothetical protein